MLMLKPPCELGPLAIEIELFDSTKSSSSIFITSNENRCACEDGCYPRFALAWGGWCSFAPPLRTPSSETGLQPNVTLPCVSGERLKNVKVT